MTWHADITPEPLPLWRALADAGTSGPCNQRDIIAAEIEALRDWLPAMPPPDLLQQWCDEAACYDLVMVRSTMEWVRDRLTEQARIARGQP